MSKNVIIGVLVLMSISLLGVAGLQLYWINNAIQVKQDEFDRSVNEALANVVEKLETQEAASVVAGQFASLQNDTTDATMAKTSTELVAATQKPADPKKGLISITSKTTPEPRSSSARHPIQPQKAKATEREHNKPRHFTIIHSDAESASDARFYFSNADSAKVKQAISKLNGAKTTSVPPSLSGGVSQFRRLVPNVSESQSMLPLHKGDIYKLEQVSDTIKFFRIDNKPVRISVDTLRTVALRMDSLLRNTKRSKEYRPLDIASLNVSPDSIFIIKGDISKPVSVTRNPSIKHNTIPVAKSRLFSRYPQNATAQPETHTLKSKTPFASSSAKSIPSSQTDNIQATVHPLKPSKLPDNKSKTSAISKIEVKKDKLNDVVQKMVVEYVVKDEPLQKRLNLGTLPDLIKAELENKGINLDFGYWVVAGQTDTIATKDIRALKNPDLPKYKASLFPNDIFDKSDHLGLYFADSRAYAIKSLWGMLSLSALFTLVMITTFGATIHIIYKQKKLSEMKNDFINNMTHEFKTPIATISLAADAIANPKIYEQPEKIKHYTGIIRQENKRMNTQVENVLQIAQLEKNDFKLNFKPVDVHLLIAKAIESIRLQVEERLGHINIQLNAMHHELRSDEVHLFNVICNLLDNANKYSPATPDISLVTQNLEGGLLIAVEDKGMGMSKETQQRVFDKFYRVPTGNLHNVKGFGLGLSYVKAIVQAHKGSVRLKSEPGKGSRFEIFLPLS